MTHWNLAVYEFCGMLNVFWLEFCGHWSHENLMCKLGWTNSFLMNAEILLECVSLISWVWTFFWTWVWEKKILWWYGFFESDMDKFWLVIGKKKKLTWNFLLVMRSVGTKFWDVVKFLLGMGFFFFFGVFWNEYFVSILMIGQLRFAEPQESR